MIDEGLGAARRGAAARPPGPYQLQAAIAALHAARRGPRTRTGRRSRRSTPRSPRMRPRRSSSSTTPSRSRWPTARTPACRLLDALAGDLDRYHLFHAARADLLRRARPRRRRGRGRTTARSTLVDERCRAALPRAPSAALATSARAARRRRRGLAVLRADALPHGRLRRSSSAVVFLGHWLLNPNAPAWKALHDRRRATSSTAGGTGASCSCSRASPSIAQLGALAVSRQQDERRRTLGDGGRGGADARARSRYFKYYGFFAVNVTNAAPRSGLHARAAADPGRRCRSAISFFTFMASRYVVDVYRRRRSSRRRWIDVFLYLSFFPHLVAGPIVRPNELIPQLDVRRDPRHVDVARRRVPDLRRPVQEGGDLELPRRRDRRPGVRRSRRAQRARDRCSRSAATRC